MNREVLTKTIAEIEKAPAKRVIMFDWLRNLGNPEVHESSGDIEDLEEWKCNSAACIAGWIVKANLSKAKNIKNTMIDLDPGMTIPRIAELLVFGNKDKEELDSLFHVKNCTLTIRSILSELSIDSGSEYKPDALFDFLPDSIRKHTVLTVLRDFRDTGACDWKDAIEQAYQTYDENSETLSA